MYRPKEITMRSSPTLAGSYRRPLLPAALPLLCLLAALLPLAPWRALTSSQQAMALPWSAVQALRPADPRHSALGSFGSPSSRVPVSAATLAAALNPAAPAYRLAPLRDPAGTGAAWGYAGVNPVAKLHLHLDANGLLLRQQGYPGSLRLALAAVGRDGQFAAAGAVRPVAAAGEIRYSRQGLAEWYRNGPLGLEQGFILAAPAAGQGHGPLTLRLHVSGDLAPRLAGGALLLGSHGLRYAGLYASDATGRPLPAHLALGTVPGGWSVGLVVDDRGARYPLTVDPAFTLQSTLPDPGSGADQFGFAVSLSGDGLTALVGAIFTAKGATALQAGAAYVFRRASTSVPFPTSPTDTLTDPGSGVDQFGYAVSLSADGLTALVGAYSTTANAGAAYAYRRASTSVPFPTSPTDTLTDPGSGADEFGNAVALSGDGLTALVGAILTAKGATAHAGAAYAYRRASTSVSFPTSPTDTLTDPGSGKDNFGAAVALSEDGLAALVGPFDTAKGATANAGAAYVYRRASTSAPFPTSPTDTLPDPGSGADQFGVAVALSGDGLTALIGAPNTVSGAGAAYTYRRASTSAPFPTSPTDTLPDPGSSADNFGIAVALSSDGLTALIGAPSGAGATYTYRRATTSSPFPTSPLDTLSNPGPSSDDFGFAVALSGDGLTALVGAYSTTANAGAAYAYQSSTTPGRTASSCSLRVGFFSTLGSTNGTSSTQFSLATGKLAGGRRTLINYLSLLGSGVLLRAVPVTATVTCLLAVTTPGSPPVQLPLQVDFDAAVVASSVSGIARLSTIHVTIMQDLGATPTVQSVTIANQARTTTYYIFDPSNTSIAPRSFVIRALP